MVWLNHKAHNVMLITIDALRADHLGCYGYVRNISPTIDSLASKGTLFLQAVTNGGGTPEAFPSILASVHPPMHQSEYTKILKQNTTIAEILSQNGYKTAAFHSNPYLSRVFHYDKGFDTFDDSIDKPELRRLVEGLSSQEHRFFRLFKKLKRYSNVFLKGHPPIVTAEALTSKAISWLQTYPDKFFLWIHYMDTHSPYMPPRKYIKQVNGYQVSRYKTLSLNNRIRANSVELSKDDFQELNSLYDACIKYIDEQIDKLLSSLGERLDNTIIVIAADHGESLGEHGFGHGMLYEEVVHIPLIISGPHIAQGTIIKTPVAGMDIAPTITNILGLTAQESFAGKAFLPLGEDTRRGGIISVAVNYPVGERILSYRTEQWKYIRTGGLNTLGEIKEQELYNIASDCKETKNLSREEKEKTKEFESRLLDCVTCEERRRMNAKIRQIRSSRKI